MLLKVWKNSATTQKRSTQARTNASLPSPLAMLGEPNNSNKEVAKCSVVVSCNGSCDGKEEETQTKIVVSATEKFS